MIDFNLKRFFLLYLLAIVLSSCSLKKIAVQVPDPPEFQIPYNIKSIVIFNRSQNAKFVYTKSDSAENFVPKLFFRKTYYDISASDSAIVSAARAIYDTQRFDVVVPLQRNIYRDDIDGILGPLDSLHINHYCTDFNVDAALVLEHFSEKINGYVSEIGLNTRMIWRFYQPGQFPLSLLTDDTLHWYGKRYQTNEEFLKKLPSLKDLLIEGGINSGKNIARQIGCVWQDQKRYYYKTGKKKIDAAIPFIRSDKWEEASAIWLKFSSVSSPFLRSKIEYNLAVSAEMTGDIDRAIDWANKSLQVKSFSKTKKYLKELHNRKTLLNKHPN
jgi:hypothetical protein